jgi:hypothetical protein
MFSSSMASFFSRASRLLSVVQRNPVAFNGGTGFVLFGASDALAQGIEKDPDISVAKAATTSAHADREPQKLINSRRLLSAAVLGIAFGGFVYPFAYARLDRLFAGVNFSSVLKKSLLEIATVGIFVNSVSIACRGLLVGRSSEDVSNHVAEALPSVTINDARVWLPYNLLAFSVIPVYIRPATTSLMEAMWQTYISLRSNDYVAPDEQSNAFDGVEAKYRCTASAV